MKHPNKAKQSVQTLDTLTKRLNVPAELQQKANAFLNASEIDTKVLSSIVNLFDDESFPQVGLMYTMEVIFKNLLKRQLVYPAIDQQTTKLNKKSKAKAKLSNKNADANAKCFGLYNKTWSHLLLRLAGASKDEASVALKVAMQLIAAEAKQTSHNTDNWPRKRLRSILSALIESETAPALALPAFEKYSRCLDVLQLSYELLTELTPSNFVDTPNQALNYLGIVNALDLGKTVLAEQQYHMTVLADSFDLVETQKHLNEVWQGILEACSGVEEKVHRQVLVVLLERILPHLENPILLTDFLMSSLHQFDGPIALLALQGIFSLMQKQNITYPDVYKKLYNMFYPRMFYNKYKARLFYLADIFLTSTHLPENLVAAFAKRMARLALRSPTEDAIILIRFVCNLLLRHTGLKRLICASAAASAVEIADPFDDTESDPVKTGAINSSLWEMVLLQKHAVPEVANAARFVSKSLPVMEFDLGQLLEMKESDIFDDDVKKVSKQFMLAYERPANIALPKHDVVTQYFDLI